MTALLQVEDACIAFGAVTAADGINLTIESGESVCIIGPNGAGKTTLLNLVTGHLSAASGAVRFKGTDITRYGPRRVTRVGIARAFQLPQLFTDMSVLDHVLLSLGAADGKGHQIWRSLRSKDRVRRGMDILERFGLEAVADRPAGLLSEGEQKVLDIVVAFASQAELIILDEPTSSVSALQKFDLMDTITTAFREANITTLYVEHDVEVVTRYASRVLVLAAGKIKADGTPAAVLADKEVQETVAGWL